MPVLKENKYKVKGIYKIGHFQTIWASKYRKVPSPQYHRERIILPDTDFVDLDWLKQDSKSLIILSHGLEGNSHRTYVKAMVHLFHHIGWDVLAWNNRSCSGEINSTPQLYGHDNYDDLAFIIDKCEHDYDRIALLGFSMGGNIILNYLAKSSRISSKILGGVAISTPVNLNDAANSLNLWQNKMYYYHFLNKLTKKIELKAEQFKDLVDLNDLKNITKWQDFDEYFSAKIAGYSDVQQFYDEASVDEELDKIKVPIYLLNAQDDPILDEKCFPYRHFAITPNHYLEPTKYGGHVGFTRRNKKYAYSEIRSAEFFNSIINGEKFD